jgi:hypothetical protein
MTPTNPFDYTSTTSYSISMTMQENVTGEGVQQVDLTGTVSANGNQMSGTYIAPAGSCTIEDHGVWTANKN